MSALHRFSPVPERAAGDQRLNVREFRVLLAICRAVNTKTGIAMISQARIAERGALARQKVSKATAGLVEKGYLERVDSHRMLNGRRPIARYKIRFAEPNHVTAPWDSPDTHDGDTVWAIPGEDTGPTPPVVKGDRMYNQRYKSDRSSEGTIDDTHPKKDERENMFDDMEELLTESERI